MTNKISDYDIIGNLQSVALVGRDGSIDWLCLPHIDSPSVFAALLDPDAGGAFSITPEGEWDSTLSYLEDSNVLTGRFRTRSGSYTLTDFLTLPEAEAPDGRRDFVLLRLIKVDRGKVRIRVRFSPRFDYGRVTARLTSYPGRGVVASGSGRFLALSCTGALTLEQGGAEGIWELGQGERAVLRLLTLPCVFKWYDDLGKNAHDEAVFVARFTDEEIAREIREHPESFQLEYAQYDWRLTSKDSPHPPT